jgi:hypothetical protein
MGKSWPAEVCDHETNAVTWEEGSSDWTRTSNPAINSRMLCRLSYGGPSDPSCGLAVKTVPDAVRDPCGRMGAAVVGEVRS